MRWISADSGRIRVSIAGLGLPSGIETFQKISTRFILAYANEFKNATVESF